MQNYSPGKSSLSVSLPTFQPSSNIILNTFEIGNARPYVTPDGVLHTISADGTAIYKSDNFGMDWKIIRTFSSGALKTLVTLSSGKHIGIFGGISNIALFEPDFSDQVYTAKPAAMNTRLLSSQVSIDYKEEGNVVMFADYAPDVDTNGKRVWRTTDDGATWTQVFEDLGVRHWHSCQVDPFTGDWWICSGDAASETKIYKSTDDGANWTLIDEGDLILKAIKFVFTRDKIMWGTDEIGGAGSRAVVTDRATWNPISIGTMDGPVLGNQVTVNGHCMMHTRIEAPSPGSDIGRIYLTDGVTLKEVFNYRIDEPNADGSAGFTFCSIPDKYNRVCVNANADRLITLSLPIII